MSNPDRPSDVSGEAVQGSSPGRILKAARIEQNQSQLDISKALYISEQRVEALEQDYYTPFSGRTYVRGYLLNYARMLNLDSQPLLDAFNQIAPESAAPTDRYRSREELSTLYRKPRRLHPGLIVTLSLALVLVIGYLINASSLFERAKSSALITDPPSAGSTQPSPLIGPAPRASNGSKPTQTEPLPLSQPIPTVAISTAPIAIEPTTETTVVSAENVELKLTFADQCWTDIRDVSGTKLHYDLQPPNSEIAMTVTLPVKVFLGNAVGTKIFYNGKPYPFPFRGRIANFTLSAPPADPDSTGETAITD